MRVSWITFAEAYLDSSGNLTSDLASLRYRVIAAARGIDAGHMPKIIAVKKPATEEQISTAETSDVVVFSKSFLPSNEELLRRVKAKGAITIFDVCDNHYDHADYSPHYRAMSAAADQVVCNTEQMALAARPYCHRPPVIIQDPYEGPGGRYAGLPDNPKLLWFGHPSNFDSLQGCLSDLVTHAHQKRPLSLVVLSQINAKLETFAHEMSQRHAPYFSLAFQPWSLEGQWKALAACDAVIIPSLQDKRKQVKSANRMIEALWAGKPVVAQPMPAYTAFGQWTPITSLISEGLEQLMTEREQIASRIQAAQTFIADQYSPTVIGSQWKQLLMQQNPEGAHHEA